MTPPEHRADPAPAIATVLDAVRAGGLLDAGPVIALVSGGRDSVCLLDVAVTVLGPAAVRVLHVDYGLRPQSAADAGHVRDLADTLGVECEIVRAGRAPEASGNVQAWARDVRYAHAARRAESVDGRVATGHTASDQVETVLYRLAASPGRRALLGMPAVQGRLIRPLLQVTREQTTAYCRARGLRWREDATNDSDLYARARVRKGLVPLLRELHPAAEQNLLRTTELLRDEAAVLDEVVTVALAGRDRITLERLAELPAALGRLVVVRLAEDAAGTFAPAAGNRLPELLALGRRGGSASLDLGGGLQAIVEYGVLRFSAAPGEPAPAAVDLRIPGTASFGRWELSCEAIDPATHAARDEAVLDADALGSMLTVRPWRTGDRMAPAGLKGTRTLADLFTDRRVPRGNRATIPVIEAHGVIAWVPGVASAEQFKVTPGTRHAARLTARRPD